MISLSGLLDTLGALSIFGGAAFLALGGLGLLRMPDVFTRIQAGTKATTLGTLLVLLGAALIMPAWSIKLALIGLFLMFTNPLSSQVLARSAHRSGAPMAPETKADHLKESRHPPSDTAEDLA